MIYNHGNNNNENRLQYYNLFVMKTQIDSDNLKGKFQTLGQNDSPLADVNEVTVNTRLGGGEQIEMEFFLLPLLAFDELLRGFLFSADLIVYTCLEKLPSRELTYPPTKLFLAFPGVRYDSFLEGTQIKLTKYGLLDQCLQLCSHSLASSARLSLPKSESHRCCFPFH